MNRKLVLLGAVSLLLCGCGNKPDEEGNVSKAFDISKLNGKTFFEYYPYDNELCKPGVEFPYTYTIPEGVYETSHYEFEWITIRDGKIYSQEIHEDKQENTVVYTTIETQINPITIDDRYFSLGDDYSEIVFSENLIILNRQIFVTEEYATTVNANIFDLADQHHEWYCDKIFNLARNALFTSIKNALLNLSGLEDPISLPTKITVNFNNENKDVLVAYNSVTPSDTFQLTENTLKVLSARYLNFTIELTLSFEGVNKNCTFPLSLL